MGHILAGEFKNSIWNARFFAGVLLILVAALVSEQLHLQFFIDAGGSQEGPGWFHALL